MKIYQHYLPDITPKRNVSCVFHADGKTKSLNVFQAKSGDYRFKCFGCGASGDSIEFILKKENVDKKEAIKIFKQYAKGCGLGISTKESKTDGQEFNLDVVRLSIEETRRPICIDSNKYTYFRHHLYDAAKPPYMKVIFKNDSGDKTARVFHLVDKKQNVWTFKKGGDSVLYNQKELAERPNDLVLYSGSEKDVNTLKDLGYLAVTAGGDEDFTEKMIEQFKGRDVCFLSHNDDSGYRSTNKIEQHILPFANSVKEADLVTQWEDLFDEEMPEKADITDFIEKFKDKQDLNDIKLIINKMIDGAKSVQVEAEALSIDENLMPVIPFPLHVFPEQLQKFIKEVSISLHINTTMVACAILPIISSAIGNTVRVSPKADWQEPVFIWLIIIELTGRGKSPLMRILSKHIKQLQSLSEKEYSAKIDAYRKQVKSVKNDKNNKEKEIMTSIDGDMSDYVEKPKRKHYFVQNFTIEALTDVFDDDPRGTMVYRDELAGFILSLNQYKKNSGDDRQQIIELWDAGVWKNDRKTEKKYLPNTGVGLIGGIQTSKLSEIFREDSFDDGLLPRFLPLNTENKPSKFSRETVSGDSYNWYTELLDSCYDKKIEFDENGCIKHVILELDEDAVRIFEEFHKIREYEEFVSRGLSAFIPKLVSYCLRIAGVLHEIECYVSGNAGTHISKKTITNAIEVTKFFAGQAVKVIKLYDGTEASLNELQKKLIGVLCKLQNQIKNGRLPLSKIVETLNTELPKQLRIEDNRVVGTMLRDVFGLNMERKGGKFYLIWESGKIQKLFLRIGLISPVSPTCPKENAQKQDIQDLNDMYSENNVVNLEDEELEIIG